MAVLLVVLLSAGVFNLLQFRNANDKLTLTATPGNVPAVPLAPCVTGQIVFVVSLNRPADTLVSVHYATSAGTAKTTVDFEPASGDLQFPVNARDRLVCVTPLTRGGNFSLNLSSPIGATLTTPQVVGNLPAK